MCGLVAVIDKSGQAIDASLLKRMADTIVHRGPDDSGYWSTDGIGLAFRRLSIQDLSQCGHQPMTSPDGHLTIVFNGEIYNFIELRTELESLGHQFMSRSDTEVLLKSYQEWGEDCLNRLNGMWAFVIHDRRNNVVFGSRDRLGIKPLYRYENNRHILLASEIKAILASSFFKPRVNVSRAADFLIHGNLDCDHNTFFENIEQLPAGHAFRIEHGRYLQWPYWRINANTDIEISDAPERFASLFEESIALQMRSDVPVGVNLSGGLDSTSIICAAARNRAIDDDQSPLLAFCYMSPEFDESKYIKETLSQTGAKQITLQVSPDNIWKDFETLIGFHDEPFHSMTAVIGYQLMQLAANNGVKVLLNGQGADEVLGGYPGYFRDYWYTLARKGQLGKAWREIAAYAASYGKAAPPLFGDLIKHVFQSMLHYLPVYRQITEAHHRKLLTSNEWLDSQLTQHCPTKKSLVNPTLDRTLTDSVRSNPLPLYLRVEDRNSMACSIEARVPFLDHRIVEFSFSLKEEWKLRGPWNKYILREAMRGRIPEIVRTRPDKMGFPTSVATWIRNDLYLEAYDLISSASGETPYLNTSKILDHLRNVRNGSNEKISELVRVMCFILWHRRYIS